MAFSAKGSLSELILCSKREHCFIKRAENLVSSINISHIQFILSHLTITQINFFANHRKRHATQPQHKKYSLQL